MSLKEINRVVTGHDEHGKAIILKSGQLNNIHHLEHAPGMVFHEVWNTGEHQVITAKTEDVATGAVTLSPTVAGTRFRFVDFPPDSEYIHKLSLDPEKSSFKDMGEVQAATSTSESKHPMMHRTETIDYGIVISGSITLLLDDEEIEVHENSVVVQRGTNHAWANRTDQVCRMAFILTDATYDNELGNYFSK
ncbi:cupin domain-containing protein [Acinetobacter wuhouensis]|uniref:cupin domain-containing protein n=1 Tax=Acinetobacter TaxID=469 RepID=UPI00083AC7EC|nr:MULTISPECIES: cupin domain-containing protein [Acinetobacter]AXQ21698.1 cupin domain-containing protein [Acinetobacter wuhouensis]RZG72524.1 cupin domain-containing protein [Acinetobacter wuhouensis]